MLKWTVATLIATAALSSGLAFADAPATQPAKPYPLKNCVVSKEDLGDMGEPIVLVYNGQEVKFCCSGCVSKFKKDPAKYMKEIEEAEKAPSTKPSK